MCGGKGVGGIQEDSFLFQIVSISKGDVNVAKSFQYMLSFLPNSSFAVIWMFVSLQNLQVEMQSPVK
jgi:hypothetical protein